MQIRVVNDNNIKQNIAELVLRDLPEWFGIEKSTKRYINTVKNYQFFAAFDGANPIGFYSLRHENKNVLDMYVLGILKKYHGKGVGTLLQNAVEEYAKKNGYKYLMVLTLAEKEQNKEYLLTRRFYLKMGFTDFYQNDNIFDSDNTCQTLIKSI